MNKEGRSSKGKNKIQTCKRTRAKSKSFRLLGLTLNMIVILNVVHRFDCFQT